MHSYTSNIEELTLANNNFRQVLHTGTQLQLVVMCLQPGEEIGQEIHQGVDQFFRVEAGRARFTVDGIETEIGEDEVFIVHSGSEHNVSCVGEAPLKLYTLYAPPNHPDGTIHATKTDADEAEHEH
jgi:mannose-6-phosphate isomerase-like protein (cupin superfamily)